MGPKEKPSKKNVLKKKEQAIEDRTFGLKNKNKSKKVQGFIAGIVALPSMSLFYRPASQSDVPLQVSRNRLNTAELTG